MLINKKLPKLNNRGFALLSIMFVSILLGGIWIYFIRGFTIQKAKIKQAAHRFDIEHIFKDIKSILINPLNCQKTFEDFKIGSINEKSIDDIIQVINAGSLRNISHYKISTKKENNSYGIGNLKIHQYLLEEKSLETQQTSAEDQTLAQYEYKLFEFKVTFDRGKGSSTLSTQYITKSFDIFALVKSGNIIDICSSGILEKKLSELKSNIIVADVEDDEEYQHNSGINSCKLANASCRWVKRYFLNNLSKIDCDEKAQRNHIKSCETQIGRIFEDGCISYNTAFCIKNYE